MAAEPGFDALARTYSTEVRPLVVQYCHQCHSGEVIEAEIDLSSFASFADVQKHPGVWLKVAEMLDSGQMPTPEAEKQPTDEERAKLRGWVWGFLKEEAKRNAGDPGPVGLRRLSNAEYAYTVRDLTGVESLDPAREFPTDGGAGEGFTNAGQALVMSPTLVAKYLDAGKDIAAHAVLLPDGIRFSPKTTRRDWTNEILGEIRQLYSRYSDAQGASEVNLQGVVFQTNDGGRLPVERYFAALLAMRQAEPAASQSIEEIAAERGLSPKYLGTLHRVLELQSDPKHPSLLLDNLRSQWRTAKPEDAPALATAVARWQQSLWRFTNVGHIGRLGSAKSWMEPISPITDRHEIRLALPAPTDGKDVVFYLSASDAGDGSEGDFSVWERPRLVAPGRPDLLLRDVRGVLNQLDERRTRIVASAAKCLAATEEASKVEIPIDVNQLAKTHEVEADALAAWLDYLGIGRGGPVKISNLIQGQTKSLSGYDFVQGWVGDDALSIVANSSDQHVRVPGNMAPHSVAVHPSPTLQGVVGWRSPGNMTLKIDGVAQHAHPECGNGVAWTLDLLRGSTRQHLATGIAHGPNKAVIGPLENVTVQTGDVVALLIGPRDANHSCDLTLVDLTLDDGGRQWNLSRDVSSDILAGNPHADGHGNADVWYFYSEPAGEATGKVIPAGSILARWQSAASADERAQLAGEVQRLLEVGPVNMPPDSPDVALHRQLTSLAGPLFASALHAAAAEPSEPSGDRKQSHFGLDPSLFGKHPNGSAIEPASLCVRAPSVLEVRLPAELVAGAEFVTAGTIHPESAALASVQFQLLTTKPDGATGLQVSQAKETTESVPWTSNSRRLSYETPIIAMEGPARQRMQAAFDDFRQIFPPALCYTKIVPVDEVVTLTLYYREDDALCRLMLNDDEVAHLNRLWDEMHFVSQDALAQVDAYEQLLQFATQDADPKVFEPMREGIYARAAAFKEQLAEAQPRHVQGVLDLAQRAYRRPLSESESADLKSLHGSLRDQGLAHDESIRLMLARVLVAPAFLYRTETGDFSHPSAKPMANAGTSFVARPVSDYELATRLSYFLWSSLPDQELLDDASQGTLRNQDVLLAQSKRMAKDARIRRLATEFACQWLHIYDFAAHDEKSETTFPEFASLRGLMYEEAIQSFTDLFQRDGSVLEILDSDHAFLNEELATHYAIPGVKGSDWRRVDGVGQYGRGGILGMAAMLSKQSGASRTSPILRGNWLCEVLLGEKLPKPPKDVPVLPDVVPVGLTERQLIEKHSSVQSCAKCHEKMDPFGFALEGFDAIGRNRIPTVAVANAPAIDVTAVLKDGTKFEGVDGLRNYLLTERRDDFLRQFCKKLLGYALGRGVILSDEPLLEEMQQRLKANDYRVSAAIQAIVLSDQFRKIRADVE